MKKKFLTYFLYCFVIFAITVAALLSPKMKNSVKGNSSSVTTDSTQTQRDKTDDNITIDDNEDTVQNEPIKINDNPSQDENVDNSDENNEDNVQEGDIVDALAIAEIIVDCEDEIHTTKSTVRIQYEITKQGYENISQNVKAYVSDSSIAITLETPVDLSIKVYRVDGASGKITLSIVYTDGNSQTVKNIVIYFD